MTILVDECLPEELKAWLPEWNVRTVQEMGWAGVKNGELLRRAEGQFDLFITADKNIRFQQNLEDRRIAILAQPSNRLTILRAMLTDIQSGIARMVVGGASLYVELPWPG